MTAIFSQKHLIEKDFTERHRFFTDKFEYDTLDNVRRFLTDIIFGICNRMCVFRALDVNMLEAKHEHKQNNSDETERNFSRLKRSERDMLKWNRKS